MKKSRRSKKKKAIYRHKSVQTLASEPTLFNKKNIAWLLLIIGLSYFAYHPALKNNITNWDDTKYIMQNPFIQEISLKNIKSVFSQYYMSNYHPLTMLSLTLDYQLGEFNPWVYHFTNIILHLINIVLVFLLIYLLFNRLEIALISSVLFGVHTLHVESVAWAAQRKDVLYALFFLASLIAYVTYTRKNKTRYYFYSLILFVLSLLSKGMAVSLSVTLIAIDILHGRNIFERKIICEKIPFFVLSLIFGIVAILAQSGDAIPYSVGYFYRFYERVLFACYGFTQYLIKLITPIKLSAIYPYPDKINGSIPFEYWLYSIPVFIILVATIYTLKQMKLVAFGLLFFFINIFLVLQLLPVGNAIMADRYSYIPSIGIFLLIGIVYRRILEKNGKHIKIVKIVFVLYIIFLSVLTFNRSQVWKDSLTLWNDVLSKYPKELTALNSRGIARRAAGDFVGAIEDYDKIIKYNPEYMKAYVNRGTTRIYVGDLNGAIEDYDHALKVNPDFVEAYAYKGFVKNLLRDYSGAVADCNKTIKQRPDFADAFLTRGAAKNNLRDYSGAIADFNTVIKLKPNNPKAYYNRGMAKLFSGQKKTGCMDLLTAHKLGSKGAYEKIKIYCIP